MYRFSTEKWKKGGKHFLVYSTYGLQVELPRQVANKQNGLLLHRCSGYVADSAPELQATLVLCVVGYSVVALSQIHSIKAEVADTVFTVFLKFKLSTYTVD